MVDINWNELRELAIDAMKTAYAPYSGYPVGAAALVDDGRLVSGCNVENASTGLGTCAENGLVSILHRTGGGRLVAFYCVNGNSEVIVPCGRCRQLLFEHGGPNLLLTMPTGIMTMKEVLPQGFGPADLARVETSQITIETPYALRDTDQETQKKEK
ncbi:cytidine deaminase [Arcanobacterium phocisimile]|uniref:Cytidine deaminase n=1 Tax=Arcanobacterium phocisimile TaxID=1302235 RepID=A0ABX7IG41_9ACTO|nr:cytidine deaminase [Arcanobacterium phocisimile]QRV01725.1 cytidine deaminase [Arcanobacterium phocisimile]